MRLPLLNKGMMMRRKRILLNYTMDKYHSIQGVEHIQGMDDKAIAFEC